jgi:hypothetical protein
MNLPNYSDPLLARPDLQSLRNLQQSGQSRTVGNIAGLTIRSHLQPIFSVAHSRAVGYEGLMRPSDATGNPVSPLDAFRLGRDFSHVLTLDRLATAVHVHNFMRLKADGWRFLNMNTEVFLFRPGVEPAARYRQARPVDDHAGGRQPAHPAHPAHDAGHGLAAA